MSTRYDRARTVSIEQIATELGWGVRKTTRVLRARSAWVSRFSVGPRSYKAEVFEILRLIYGLQERPDDRLAKYLQEIADAGRRSTGTSPGTGTQGPQGGTADCRREGR